MTYLPQLRNTVEGVSWDIFELVVGQIELDEVGEVPQSKPVQSGDLALVERDLLQVNEIVRGEDIAGQHCQLTAAHIQHLKTKTIKNLCHYTR